MSGRFAWRAVLVALLAVGLAWSAAGLLGDTVFLANEEANGTLTMGDGRAALIRYRTLQRERPELREIDVNAGLAMVRIGDAQRALLDFSSGSVSSDAAVRSAAFYDRGNALFTLQRFADARASWVDSLRADPTRRDAKYNIEVVDGMFNLLAPDQTAAAGGPPPSGQPPAQPQPGASGNPPPPSQIQPGDPRGNIPPDDPNPNASAPPSVGQAVAQFRRNLSVNDALRVLDALRAEQQGLEGFLEGTPSVRNPSGPVY